MGTYKKSCIHCGAYVEGDSRFCTNCGKKSPFNYLCPNCLSSIQRGSLACPSCKKPLMTMCPWCGGSTFVGSEDCDLCGKTLLKRCENPRCGDMQFFENIQCTTCGKAL